MKKVIKQRRGNNEGSVFQNSKGMFVGYVNLGRDDDGKRKRKYIYGHSKEEVEQKVAKLTGTISSLKIESLQNSFCDLMKEWLLVFKINDVSSRVFEDCMRNYNLHIKPNLQNMGVLQIDSVVIKKLLNRIYSSNHSHEVVRKTKTLLKQFFDYAVEEKLVQYNPVLSVNFKVKEKRDLSEMKRPYKAIPPEDRKKFLEALTQNSFLLTLCFIGFYMGLRIGEILALKWKDVDFKTATLNINKGVTYTVDFDENGNKVGVKTIVSTPKTSVSVALLPIPNVLLDALKRWKDLQKEKGEKLGIELASNDDFIFCNDDKSVRTYYGTRTIYNRFLRRNKLNEQEFHFHALRHTFGTILKENEENLYNIQLLLRHATAKTTERYLSIDTQKALSLKTHLDVVFQNLEQKQ